MTRTWRVDPLRALRVRAGCRSRFVYGVPGQSMTTGALRCRRDMRPRSPSACRLILYFAPPSGARSREAVKINSGCQKVLTDRWSDARTLYVILLREGEGLCFGDCGRFQSDFREGQVKTEDAGHKCFLSHSVKCFSLHYFMTLLVGEYCFHVLNCYPLKANHQAGRTQNESTLHQIASLI